MVLYVISIQAGATITRNVIPIFQSIDFFQKSGTGNFGSGNSGQELTQTVLPTPDSRLPTPDSRLPTPWPLGHATRTNPELCTSPDGEGVHLIFVKKM
ncbi:MULTISPECIES: hypothetical protein [unclassified Moorena]|uniref:hypothetical protein n=1 Tax=unclassified Moorena TaxID=2683338 RepID=UPI0013C753D9|nr:MULTISPECIES: hypothetical protein [unclassified Moorena]NEO19729.1 hypothetical protein [Moorena sp. SIO4A5]NEP22507.1 hypothetical protein [Moorena sp. SIO3I6]NEQ58758.1 hypothetical protein [Moorena sp. SIO4A1]